VSEIECKIECKRSGRKHDEDAVAVTRRLLDDWIPDVERLGWWHVGSGMQGPGEPMTAGELAWLSLVDDRTLTGQ
jgi:hypothetical protein